MYIYAWKVILFIIRDNIFKILPEEQEDDNKKPTGNLGMHYHKVKETKNVSENNNFSNNLLNYGENEVRYHQVR